MSIATVRNLAAGLEAREQARLGGSRDAARSRLARRLSVAPGTLYNLARDRLKRCDASLRERLVAYAVQDIEQEIARLEHDLAVARTLGCVPGARFALQVEALLKRALTLRDEAGGG